MECSEECFGEENNGMECSEDCRDWSGNGRKVVGNHRESLGRNSRGMNHVILLDVDSLKDER